MLWLQSLVCFCAWVGYGVFLARSPYGRRILPLRRASIGAGALALVGGMLALVGTLTLVGSFGGLVAGALTPWAWAAVFTSGLAFVHLQSAGALMMFHAASKPETSQRAKTSVPREDSL